MGDPAQSKPAAIFPYDKCSVAQIWPDAFGVGGTVDVQGSTKFCFEMQSRVGSCGSCFATRIAQEFRRFGVNYVVTEPGPTIDRQLAIEYGYWPLSARFGNVYTTIQLAQLMERALGYFEPGEQPWRDDQGKFRDPFRPHIQPVGFDSETELAKDRELHYAAVRELFNTVEVFVATFGLTDAWISRADGSAFPRCPGRGIGSFDDNKYILRSLDVAENITYIERFLELLRSVNPNAKVILSVSPVHLLATVTDVHIGRASAYAKANLRAAVETVVRRHPHVDYFASYEIVALPQPGPSRYTADYRHASEDAIADVVRSFFRHFMGVDSTTLIPVQDNCATTQPQPCDEEELLRLISSDAAP